MNIAFQSALGQSTGLLAKAKARLARAEDARDAADAAIDRARENGGAAGDDLHEAYGASLEEWSDARNDLRRLVMLNELGRSAL